MTEESEQNGDPVIQARVHSAVRAWSSLRNAIVEQSEILAEKDPRLGTFAKHLCFYISGRCQAASFIIQYLMYWDAEILLRAAAEATIKLLYVLYAEPDEREDRLEEYYDGLGAVGALKASSRAKIRIQELPDGSRERPIFEAIVLSEDEEARIRARWTKSDRRRLATQWSFPAMTEWVENRMTDMDGKVPFRVLLHSYGISSRVAHSDETGVGIILERFSRSADERIALDRSHGARLVSDTVMYYTLELVALHRANGKPKSVMVDEALSQSIAFIEASHEEEYSFYDSIGLPQK